MGIFVEWINGKTEECREGGDVLLVRAKLHTNFDIPFLAGYSKDGHHFYVDRHVPEFFKYKGHAYDFYVFLLRHESVEKFALIKYKMDYEHAHRMATKAEREKVEAAGIPWKAYQKYCDKWIKYADNEKIGNLPPDLDLTPYQYFHGPKDVALLKKMKQLMGRN